jgi:stalled ribosome alternative rescue factor ArfA
MPYHERSFTGATYMKKGPGKKSKAKSMVMIPLYRQRVVTDKTGYSRKEKHNKKPSSEGFAFIGIAA